MRTNHLLFGAVLALVGCSEHEFHQVTAVPSGSVASLSGRVCDPAKGVWLEGATVYTHVFNDDGVLYATEESITDAEGRWKLEQLYGGYDYDIYVQYGSELIDQFRVTLPDGEDLVLDDPACSGGAPLQVAVVTGDYDQFDVLLGEVGISEVDLVNGLTGDELFEFLSNADTLADYDAIFLNGGHREEDVFYDRDGSGENDVAAVVSVLEAWVQSGGLLYSSDWSYDAVEALWPKRIDFLGEDTVADEAQKGEPMEVKGSIVDADLESYVGGTNMDIDFDLDAWPVMESVDSTVTIHVQASSVRYREGFDVYTVADAPLLVSFPVGDGTVVVSSWRQAANSEGRPMKVLQYLLKDLE